MKTIFNLNKWLFIAVLTCVSVVFASCSSDDKEEEVDNPKLANELVGTYTGYLSGGSDDDVVTAEVTAIEDNRIRFKILTPDNLGLPELESDLMLATSNQIVSTTSIIPVVYRRKEKNISIAKSQKPNIYVFEGYKK